MRVITFVAGIISCSTTVWDFPVFATIRDTPYFSSDCFLIDAASYSVSFSEFKQVLVFYFKEIDRLTYVFIVFCFQMTTEYDGFHTFI